MALPARYPTSYLCTMLKRGVSKTLSTRPSRAVSIAPRCQTAQLAVPRSFTTTPLRRKEKDDLTEPPPDGAEYTTGAAPGLSGDHEGQFARTDPSVVVEYPEDDALPSSKPVRGRGGMHYKRTLASFSLEDHVAIVTGGARGLGLIMAQALIESGAHVALVDLNVDEARQSAAQLVETFKRENDPSDAPPKVTAHHADVADPESVTECINDVVKQHGKVDVLVTSAGFTENFPAEQYPVDRMRKLWSVNVDGTYLFATGVARHLMERDAKGSIIFIGSMSGSIVNVPQPQAPYNAAKAAVRHLASSLAVEWAEKGIRVNCISPGYMLTALTQKILDDNPDLHKKWTSLIPVGKIGRPVDLMGAVTFLASDASGYVTGADLRVDGGYTLI